MYGIKSFNGLLWPLVQPRMHPRHRHHRTELVLANMIAVPPDLRSPEPFPCARFVFFRIGNRGGTSTGQDDRGPAETSALTQVCHSVTADSRIRAAGKAEQCGGGSKVEAKVARLPAGA